jgi:hypothetical protein
MDWHCLRHGVYREAAFVVWMETYVCHGHGELAMMNELEGPERAPLSSKWNRSTPRSRQVVPLLWKCQMPNAIVMMWMVLVVAVAAARRWWVGYTWKTVLAGNDVDSTTKLTRGSHTSRGSAVEWSSTSSLVRSLSSLYHYDESCTNRQYECPTKQLKLTTPEGE